MWLLVDFSTWAGLTKVSVSWSVRKNNPQIDKIFLKGKKIAATKGKFLTVDHNMDVDNHGQGQNTDLQDLGSLKDMPEEVLEIIRLRNSPHFLDALSLAALKPALTLKLFTIFK